MILFIKFWLDISNLIKIFIIGIIIHLLIFTLILIFAREGNTILGSFFLSFFTNLLPCILTLHTITTIFLFFTLKKINYKISLRITCYSIHIILSTIYSIWLSKKNVHITNFFGEHFDFYTILFFSFYICISALVPCTRINNQ